MRAASTTVSLVAHVVVIVAAVWSTTQDRPGPTPVRIIELPPVPRGPATGAGVVGTPTPTIEIPPVDVSRLVLPKVDAGNAATPQRFVVAAAPGSGPVFAPGSGDGSPVDGSLVDDAPMMLVGPAPAYPDLLRQAGVQGRVVVEVVIDTLGHVEPGSFVVVGSAHPAFVASALQSIRASLFRPARVLGRVVRVRVRIPIDFVLRDGRLLK